MQKSENHIDDATSSLDAAAESSIVLNLMQFFRTYITRPIKASARLVGPTLFHRKAQPVWAIIFVVVHIFITFALSFGGAYDIEGLLSSSAGDCQAPHFVVYGRG